MRSAPLRTTRPQRAAAAAVSESTQEWLAADADVAEVIEVSAAALVFGYDTINRAMGTIDLRFTLFNLPILPAILGIGVDNGVYLTDRIRRSKGEVDGLLRSLEETGGAIIAAMATTAIGFAAFMVGDSAGVRGIGAVAVLGIAFAAFAATVVLPALSGVARARRR